MKALLHDRSFRYSIGLRGNISSLRSYPHWTIFRVHHVFHSQNEYLRRSAAKFRAQTEKTRRSSVHRNVETPYESLANQIERFLALPVSLSQESGEWT